MDTSLRGISGGSTRNCDDAPDDSLLSEYARKPDVAEMFGISERTLERWVRLRLIPAPLKLGRLSLFHLPTLRSHLKGISESKAAALSRAGGRRR